MTGLAIAAGILLIIGFCRVRVRASRKTGGAARVILRVGPFRFNILKRLEKPEKKEKKPKKKKDFIEKYNVWDMLGAGKALLGKILKAVRVDRLCLSVTVGKGDPCDAALAYGRMIMAWAILRPVIVGIFRVRGERVEFALDFERSEWSCDVEASISVGRLLGFVFSALGVFASARVRDKEILDTQ